MNTPAPMHHVMLDLETLGTAPGSAIVAIGAVAFNPLRNEIGAEFYATINLPSCLRAGLKLDADTVLWWLRQKDEARAVFLANDKAPSLREVLDRFTVWLAGICEPKQLHLWGNGSDFDNALLAAAYGACGLGLPWRYSANRCFRTAKALYPNVPAPERLGVHHHALDDARTQATHLSAMMQAGALILAEIERLERLGTVKKGEA